MDSGNRQKELIRHQVNGNTERRKVMGDYYYNIGIDSIFTAQRIEQLRLNRGETVEQFTERIGISPSAYYKWMQGKSLPSLDHLIILRKMCNVPLDDIVITREGFEREC